MPRYKFAREGFFDGTWRKVGDPITLTDRQAKYPLLDQRIVPADAVVAETVPAPAPIPAKRRPR